MLDASYRAQGTLIEDRKTHHFCGVGQGTECPSFSRPIRAGCDRYLILQAGNRIRPQCRSKAESRQKGLDFRLGTGDKKPDGRVTGHRLQHPFRIYLLEAGHNTRALHRLFGDKSQDDNDLRARSKPRRKMRSKACGFVANSPGRVRADREQDNPRKNAEVKSAISFPPSRFHYGWVILAVGTLVVFGSLGLARFGYTVVLPAMQEGLEMDNTQAGVLATANLVGYLALSVIGGALAARYGPRAVIAAGLAVSGVGMLLTGLANGFLAAAAWRALTGIGSGASNVPVMGLLVAWFAPRRRGLASGIAVAGSSLGLIFVGPLVPRILSAHGESGWRICWFIFGGVTLLLAVGSFLFLRNRPSEIGLKPLGADAGDTAAIPRAKALQWGKVYRSPVVWHVGLVYVAFGFSYIIYMTFFTKCLIVEGGYTQEAAGNLFMTMGWFSLLCGLIWGTISDVIGRKRALIIVYLIHAIAFSLFALRPEPLGFTLSAILFGLSAWSIPAIMAATCGDMLGPRLAPAALGFITLFFGIGQAAGPMVAGAIADAADSLLTPLLLAGGVALLGALGASLLREAPGSSGQPQPTP